MISRRSERAESVKRDVLQISAAASALADAKRVSNIFLWCVVVRSCLKIDCQPDQLGMFELGLTKPTLVI